MVGVICFVLEEGSNCSLVGDILFVFISPFNFRLFTGTFEGPSLTYDEDNGLAD